MKIGDEIKICFLPKKEPQMSDLKSLVIYHDNCADGFGAAWAAYK